MALPRRSKLRYQQQQVKNKEHLRRSRQDLKVEKLTGVPGLIFHVFVAEIQQDKGLTYDGARKHAHVMLGELEILSRLALREAQEQWRINPVHF